MSFDFGLSEHENGNQRLDRSTAAGTNFSPVGCSTAFWNTARNQNSCDFVAFLDKGQQDQKCQEKCYADRSPFHFSACSGLSSGTILESPQTTQFMVVRSPKMTSVFRTRRLIFIGRNHAIKGIDHVLIF